MSDERQTFRNLCLTADGRERSDGLYRVITYLCAKMLDELIVAACVSFGLSCLLFFGVGFPGELVLFWLVYLTTLAIGVGAPHAAHSAFEKIGFVLALHAISDHPPKAWAAHKHMSAASTFFVLPDAEGCTAGAVPKLFLCLGPQCLRTLWQHPCQPWTSHARCFRATPSVRFGVLRQLPLPALHRVFGPDMQAWANRDLLGL